MGKKEGEIEGGNLQSVSSKYYIYVYIYIYTHVCVTYTAHTHIRSTSLSYIALLHRLAGLGQKC